MNYFCGDYIESELILLTKKYATTLGSSSLLNSNYYLNNSFFIDTRKYLNNINKIKENKLHLLVNVNLRLEIPILNTEIRKNYLNLNTLIFSFNPYFDLSFSYKQMGLNFKLLKNFFEGKL